MGQQGSSSAGEDLPPIPDDCLQPKGWDKNAVLKMQIQKKLAPCWPEVEEESMETDCCSICLGLYEGGLNRCVHCGGFICTVCYLKIKNPGKTKKKNAAQCPYCNHSPFQVAFSGPLSDEERMQQVKSQQQVLRLKMQQQDRLKEESQKRSELVKKQREEAEKNDDGSPVQVQSPLFQEELEQGLVLDGTPRRRRRRRRKKKKLQLGDYVPQEWLRGDADVDAMMMEYALQMSLGESPSTPIPDDIQPEQDPVSESPRTQTLVDLSELEDYFQPSPVATPQPVTPQLSNTGGSTPTPSTPDYLNDMKKELERVKELSNSLRKKNKTKDQPTLISENSSIGSADEQSVASVVQDKPVLRTQDDQHNQSIVIDEEILV